MLWFCRAKIFVPVPVNKRALLSHLVTRMILFLGISILQGVILILFSIAASLCKLVIFVKE